MPDEPVTLDLELARVEHPGLVSQVERSQAHNNPNAISDDAEDMRQPSNRDVSLSCGYPDAEAIFDQFLDRRARQYGLSLPPPVTSATNRSDKRGSAWKQPTTLTCRILKGIIGITVAVVAAYGTWQALPYARWSAWHDFRSDCESDQDHNRTITAACNAVLSGPAQTPPFLQIQPASSSAPTQMRDSPLLKSLFAVNFVLMFLYGCNLFTECVCPGETLYTITITASQTLVRGSSFGLSRCDLKTAVDDEVPSDDRREAVKEYRSYFWLTRYLFYLAMLADAARHALIAFFRAVRHARPDVCGRIIHIYKPRIDPRRREFMLLGDQTFYELEDGDDKRWCNAGNELEKPITVPDLPISGRSLHATHNGGWSPFPYGQEAT